MYLFHNQKKRIILSLAIISIFIEISLFILVGHAIGLLGTLSLIALLMIFGIFLIRRQSFMLFYKAKELIEQGAHIHQPLVHNFLLIFAGFLLIVPGFLTSFIGAMLCLPALQVHIFEKLIKYFSLEKNTKMHQSEIIDLDRNDYHDKTSVNKKKYLDFDDYI